MSNAGEQRESSRNLGVLAAMFAFVKPYKLQVFGASLALICTAAITLSLGQELVASSPPELEHSLKA